MRFIAPLGWKEDVPIGKACEAASNEPLGDRARRSKESAPASSEKQTEEFETQPKIHNILQPWNVLAVGYDTMNKPGKRETKVRLESLKLKGPSVAARSMAGPVIKRKTLPVEGD
jgi:hypothetical protein